MIVFKTFLNIFAGLNLQTSESSMSFVQEKPDVLIVNKGEEIRNS